MIRVDHEFATPLPKSVVERINDFNIYVEKNPETVRIGLARKALGKSLLEMPDTDEVISALLDARQPDGRLLTLGFSPANRREDIWGEVHKDANHKSARNQIGWLETELTRARSMLEADPDNESLQQEMDNRFTQLKYMMMQRRIHTLGAFAHMNTPGYEWAKASTDYIERPVSGILVPHAEAA